MSSLKGSEILVISGTKTSGGATHPLDPPPATGGAENSLSNGLIRKMLSEHCPSFFCSGGNPSQRTPCKSSHCGDISGEAPPLVLAPWAPKPTSSSRTRNA